MSSRVRILTRRLQRWFSIRSLICFFVSCAGLAVRGGDEEILKRSLVDWGDASRMQRVMARAEKGERITVAVIGGSITQGASATQTELRYGNRMAQWWKTNFTKAEVKFVNAGIGATGSDFGALRAQRDLLKHRPDFVVVEYAVNDGVSLELQESYEGLLRQILKQPNHPAVLLMFTMHRNGQNAQEMQAKIGKHYGLPAVSFRDALWPEIEAGRIKWEEVEADVVHPNDRGHGYMAAFIAHVLDRAQRSLNHSNPLPSLKAIPPPLLTDRYENVEFFSGKELLPRSNQGWVLSDKDPNNSGWKATKPGSAIEFEVTGTVVLMTEFHLRGPMGRARVTVDDRDPIVVDAWFPQTWGGYMRTHELARGLKPGKHVVRVELLAEKHAESTGTEFTINAIGSAGSD